MYRNLLLAGLHGASLGGAAVWRVAPLPAVRVGSHLASHPVLLAAARERALAYRQGSRDRGCALLQEDRSI